jgi:hypothetical protein
MHVVEPSLRRILSSTPSRQKPASLHFLVVEGALCRLHQMGARVILDPLDAIKDVLDSEYLKPQIVELNNPWFQVL